MNKFFLKTRIILFVFSSSLSSCKHDPDLSGIPEISFANDIQAIISGNCAMNGCHANDAQSEFSLTTYADVMDNGDINPGNARDSKLYEVLLETGDDKMPPNGDLTEIQIKKIYLWIEQGAKDN